jgi:hypothetical protein
LNHRARRVTVNGTKYGSMKEAARGEELKMLENGGVVFNLRFQVPFLLQPSFKIEGRTERKIEYIADAVYIFEGKLVVEDTKSEYTRHDPVFRIKKKLLLYKYPDIVFKEYI